MDNADQPLVRLITSADSDALWRIRNSPNVRAVSHNHEEIPLEKHQRWFAGYTKTPGNRCYVIEVNGKVAGYCRIDQRLISIAIDPDYHGQGLGKRLLQSVVQTESAVGPIKAEIRRDNPASLRLFETAGFRIVEETSEYGKYEYAHQRRG